ncbi:hypothetical protein BJY04DRAFT_196350 [Aspergillus karnatakaensis]|uniref:uncharacterized protein n=1 Tax=Aspergillus karnatakaensis TaxID=1810916 RepID=UPI003CCD10EC
MTSGTDVDYLNFNPSTVQLNQTEIIRGSDGKIVHTILFSPSRTQPCVTDPVTGEVYFIWSPCEYQLYSILKDHPVFEKYTAIVIRAFNYDPSDTEEQRTSDARVIFYDETKSRSQIIHPMAMVSIAFEPTPSSKSKEVLRIKRRPCVPTKDAAFNQAASAVVEHLFPTEDVAVAGCFKLGQAKAVSDPVLSSNGDGRQKRAKIEINHQEKTDLYLIDAESVLVRSRSGSALVNFG